MVSKDYSLVGSVVLIIPTRRLRTNRTNAHTCKIWSLVSKPSLGQGLARNTTVQGKLWTVHTESAGVSLLILMVMVT